jgi:hypothetical protein
MSLMDYNTSHELTSNSIPFYALLMAAMRCADNVNLERLKRAFPDIHDELLKRYNSPGGILPFERDFQAFEAPVKGGGQ